MFVTNFVEKITTHISFSNRLSELLPSMRQCGKSFVQPDEPQMIIQ